VRLKPADKNHDAVGTCSECVLCFNVRLIPARARLLPDHFVRVLVFPDSEKDGLTEAIIPGPLREFDLANQHRLNPMATLHFCGR
jgi:hypothetical protein